MLDLIRAALPYVSGGISAVAKVVTLGFYDFQKDVDQKKGLKRSKSNLSELSDEDIIGSDSESEKDRGFAEEETKKRGIFRRILSGIWGGIKNTINFSIDVLFGPTTLRIISLGCAAMMLFSPLGPVVGGIAVGISALCVGYGMVQDARHFKQLRIVQKEERLLNDMLKLETKNLENLKAIAKEAPETASTLSSILDDKRQDRAKAMKIGKDDITLKVKSALDCTPENLVPLMGNILTLNPILIGLGLFSTIGTSAVAVKEADAFEQQSKELLQCIGRTKSILGLHDYSIGRGLDKLNEELKERYIEMKAVEALSKDPKIKDLNKDELEARLQKEIDTARKNVKDIEANVKESKIKSTSHYLWKNLKRGLSYDKDYENRAPLSRHKRYEHDSLKDAYREASMSFKRSTWNRQQTQETAKVVEKAETIERSESVTSTRWRESISNRQQDPTSSPVRH